MTPDDLKRLRNSVNKSVERAYRRRHEISGAINWANLSCVEAAFVLCDDGSTRLEVLIEEADPSATELAGVVRTELAIDGWPDVDVRMEW